jgi:hypothetical protein
MLWHSRRSPIKRCKRITFGVRGRLDRTQEVAGSSPASSMKDLQTRSLLFSRMTTQSAWRSARRPALRSVIRFDFSPTRPFARGPRQGRPAPDGGHVRRASRPHPSRLRRGVASLGPEPSRLRVTAAHCLRVRVPSAGVAQQRARRTRTLTLLPDWTRRAGRHPYRESVPSSARAYTETHVAVAPVNGSRFQPSNRSRSWSPASRAIKSSSGG